MVLDVRRSEPTTSSSDEENDDLSISISDDGSTSYGKNLVLKNPETDATSFGNICVTNSSDVHFGNKTYYHGPVTIKQILYTNTQDDQIKDESEFEVVNVNGLNGVNNPTYVPENNDNKAEDKVQPTPPTNKESGFSWLPYVYNTKSYIILVILLVIFLSAYVLTLTVDGITNFQEDDVVVSGRRGECTDFLYKRKLILIVSFTIAIIITLVIFIVLRQKVTAKKRLYIKDSNETQIGIPEKYPVDPNVTLTLSGKLKIVSRIEWVAQPAVKQLTPLHLPVPYVIIMHTETENCTFQADCTFHIRFIQTYHIESRSWNDIAFNFMVGGDGFVYEGRGWKSEGGHTFKYNSKSIGIAFVGTYKYLKPTDNQIKAAQQLIEFGVESGFVDKDYKLLCQMQLLASKQTENAMCEDLKTWPHWSATP